MKGGRVSIEEILKKLSPVKRELFLQKIRDEVDHIRPAICVAIPPAAPQDKYHLSFSQSRLWFLTQLEPDNPFYNIPSSLRLKGSLNISALEKALNTMIARHASFRTSFIQEEGTPYQKIEETLVLDIPLTDLSSLSKDDGEKEARRLTEAESLKPFNLTHAPLLRAQLLRLGDEDHVFLLNMHHIVSDGWSHGIFWKELTTLYNAFSQGRDNPLSPLKLQYSDYALWQRKQLEGEVLKTQGEYWKSQFQGELPILDLPTDKPRPKVMTYKGAIEHLSLSKELTEKLKALSRRYNSTLYMTLLAAFNVLLSRYSGQEDIIIGSPIANRHHGDTEETIGFFVNTLALRTDLSGDPTFLELLERVRKTSLDAYKHQDYPFEQLVEVLNPTRDMSRSPVFQVMCNMINLEPIRSSFGGLGIKGFGAGSHAIKFDLTLYIVERSQSLGFTIAYNTSLFDDSTIQRMMTHFQTLLEHIVENPDLSLSEYSLIPNDERTHLLKDFNNTTTNYPQDKTTHQLFEEQVARTPDNTAVVFGDKSLTYKELNERSNQLAHYLRNRGVRPDTLVGICIERSLEMIIGILGILKAGGAYLPLDPEYPKDRIRFMLEEDSKAPILLTQSHLKDQLPDNTKAQWIFLDKDQDLIAKESTHNPVNLTSPHNLAYCIYTSGSTGVPKGVPIYHQALTNFLSAMCSRPRITARDRLLSVTTFSFDIFGLEMFLPLMVGACVNLVSRAVVSDGAELSKYLMNHDVSMMQATPATWRMLLAAEWKPAKDFKILCGGEAVSSDLAAGLIKLNDSFWNMYGPTETTIWSSTCEIVSEEKIAIGTPISNTQIHILDPFLEPTPIGVPGELHIGGVGLARGYLNRPDLTAEKFIPNPFSEVLGQRLYKTGDLARYLPDGNIEFLGRIDHQVKIRGFRIECGEIESALRDHPNIQETVVLAKEEKDSEGKEIGSKYLVAYLIPKTQDQRPNTTDLRNYLLDKLPDYMIPSHFIFLGSLPLTPNGKLDRKALPEPNTERPLLEKEYASPVLMEEWIFAGICKAVLKVDRIGMYDNLFDLGLHSLQTIQICAKVKQEYGVDLPVAAVFQKPVVNELYQEVLSIYRKDKPSSATPHCIPIQQGGSKPPLFFIAASFDTGFYFYHLMQRLGVDHPAYLFRGIQEGLPLWHYRLSEKDLEQMITQHLQEVERIDPIGPYHLVGYCSGGQLAFEIAQRLVSKGKKVSLLALIETFTFKSFTFKRESFGTRSRRRVQKVFSSDGLEYVNRNISQRMHETVIMAKRSVSIQMTRYLFDLSNKKSALTWIEKRIQKLFYSLYRSTKAPVPIRLGRVVWGRFLQSLMRRPYDGKIDVFVGWDQLREEKVILDPSAGWGGVVKGGITVHKVHGGHNALLLEPQLEVLAKELRNCIDREQDQQFDLVSDEVHVWQCSLNEGRNDLDELYGLLDEGEKSKAGRFRLQKDRELYVVTHGLLRRILAKYVKAGPVSLRYDHNPYGKPYVAEPHADKKIMFNLSHSGDRVIFAFTRESKVGVDIEHIDLRIPSEDLADQNFSVVEIETFRSLPDSLKTEAFFNCWTRKEAFIKAVGDGLSYPLKDFDVTLKPGEPAKLREVRRPGMSASEWSLYDIKVEKGYKAALAIHGHPTKILYRNITDLQ